MIKIRVLLALFIITITACNKKNTKESIVKKETKPKVVLITLDGVRWQELFSGADSLLVTNNKYVKDTTVLATNFWRKTSNKRRETLLPFFWNHIAKTGTVYGNRNYNNKVNLTNNHWFSYPGYSEILCGFADDKRVKSNDKIDNPNKTILELVNNSETYKNKVAAFGSWDVFPSIINRKRSQLPINAGFESVTRNDISVEEKLLNKFQKETPSPWHNVRLDVFTHNYALNYMKEKHPDLIYIAYGETDDFAHDGKYDQYLNAIKRSDNFIKDLWEFTQKDTYYKDNTTFIITTDHGRGTTPLETWKHHGNNLQYHGKTYTIKGADEVWIAAFGKGVTKQQGEVKTASQLYTNQIATTIEKVLNINVLGGKSNKEHLPFITK